MNENKSYTIEVSEGEAQKIEQEAAAHGVSTPDFIVHYLRSILFGIDYAVRKLTDAGQLGPFNKD